ncbi:MAG: hypothetical protein WAM14_19950 [Candidatus Nitrosopolaris sp.]
MIARIGNVNGTIMGEMFTTTSTDRGSLKYYCMSSGTQHKQAACPKCGSKMKRIGL